MCLRGACLYPDGMTVRPRSGDSIEPPCDSRLLACRRRTDPGGAADAELLAGSRRCGTRPRSSYSSGGTRRWCDASAARATRPPLGRRRGTSRVSRAGPEGADLRQSRVGGRLALPGCAPHRDPAREGSRPSRGEFGWAGSRPDAGPESEAGPDEVATLCVEVDRLPEPYRIPVLLCFFEGLTHAEAAQRTGWPIGTVAGRLARAKELLARRLSHMGVGFGLGRRRAAGRELSRLHGSGRERVSPLGASSFQVLNHP